MQFAPSKPQLGRRPIDQPGNFIFELGRARVTVKLKVQVGDWILAAILGHAGLQNDRVRAELAIFFAKTRMGWNATRHELVDGPIDAKDVRRKLEKNLARLTEVSNPEILADRPPAERDRIMFGAKDKTSVHCLSLRRHVGLVAPAVRQPRYR
jgi:hypothetical protein